MRKSLDEPTDQIRISVSLCPPQQPQQNVATPEQQRKNELTAKVKRQLMMMILIENKKPFY